MKAHVFRLTFYLLVPLIGYQAGLANDRHDLHRYQAGQPHLPTDTTPDPETHLTLDILSRLPLGKSMPEIIKFLDENKVFYLKPDPYTVTFEKQDLDYYLVEGVAYTFNQFDYANANRAKVERLTLIKDGEFTIADPRSLRNREKQQYSALARAIRSKLRAKFGPPTNGYFKCSANTQCSVTVGTSKTYDGDEIIGLYLTFELLSL